MIDTGDARIRHEFFVNLPDRMDGYVGKSSLHELRVSIDPAHGGSEAGGKENSLLQEKSVNLTLGRELTRLLESRGVEVYLLRDSDAAMSQYERTETANAWGPDIHICLHHSSSVSDKAQGAATYYFANRVYQCKTGKRLAGYIVDALCRELGRVDLRKHGRNYACLREVKPLAVMVEPGYLSHPEEGPTLADPAVISREASAILHGIEAYLARR